LKKNLTLTGMMGVGKSTIGKILAKKLNYSFVDVDKLIEAKEGLSINLIFKNKSENYFRKIEIDLTLSELRKNNTVISLGGGAFLNNTIRKSAKKLSTSFWLDVPADELVKRLKNSKQRPLLFEKNTSETVKKIYFDRKKIYNEADHRIKCSSLRSEEIINKILNLYEKSGNKI
jgi:shikimate kinase